jgi:hypothetical protein
LASVNWVIVEDLLENKASSLHNTFTTITIHDRFAFTQANIVPSAILSVVAFE